MKNKSGVETAIGLRFGYSNGSEMTPEQVHDRAEKVARAVYTAIEKRVCFSTDVSIVGLDVEVVASEAELMELPDDLRPELVPWPIVER